jgi:hypothetical protein
VAHPGEVSMVHLAADLPAAPRTRWSRPAAIGLFLGLAFGLWNLLWTWLAPLAEDTEWALLAFYGPMFIAWAVVAFRDARRTGQFRDGVFAAVVAAFVTFCVLDLLVILRVNLFLNDLTARADWQALMSRFPTSGFASVRGYINYHYVSEAPFKILVASTIGLVMGLIGASVGYTIRRAMNGRPFDSPFSSPAASRKARS